MAEWRCTCISLTFSLSPSLPHAVRVGSKPGDQGIADQGIHEYMLHLPLHSTSSVTVEAQTCSALLLSPFLKPSLTLRGAGLHRVGRATLSVLEVLSAWAARWHTMPERGGVRVPRSSRGQSTRVFGCLMIRIVRFGTGGWECKLCRQPTFRRNH